MLEDTIIAVSTPPGAGGLGIVRLSGGAAVRTAGRIFRAKKGKPGAFPVRQLVFGEIFDDGKDEVIDECFLTYFQAPHSYTCEDVVELSCHGGPAVLEEVVRLGIRAGARPAGPGEFTLRAYLNGRLDIIQAEAVNDLIRSVTPAQARLSARQVLGGLSRKLASMRQALIGLAAGLESGLEFPDERLGPSAAERTAAFREVLDGIDALISSYESGRAVREGLTVALAGRKNVGKSTIFNALIEQDRAIVTPFPGTTRDFIRESLVLGGTIFNLVDMAGLGRAADPAEKIGIGKSWKIAEEADGVILVLDASRTPAAGDRALVDAFPAAKTLVVLNKIDLPRKISPETAAALLPGRRTVEVSAAMGTNLGELRKALVAFFGPKKKPGSDVIMHARQRDALIGIKECLDRACEQSRAGWGEEISAEEIRAALDLMAGLTGEIKADDVIDDIFRRFCVGK